MTFPSLLLLEELHLLELLLLELLLLELLLLLHPPHRNIEELHKNTIDRLQAQQPKNHTQKVPYAFEKAPWYTGRKNINGGFCSFIPRAITHNPPPLARFRRAMAT